MLSDNSDLLLSMQIKIAFDGVTIEELFPL
jgi:hypothetical protein